MSALPAPRPASTLARSFCPLDCPDSCSLEVHIEDGRVTRLEGDRRNPVTAGFICTKVRHFPQHMYGPERLLHPQIRVGAKGEGRLRPCSWDEALDLIAARLREIRERHGGEAILPFSYGGSNGRLSEQATDARFFRRLGASRLGRTICAATAGRAHAGLYGRMSGVGYEDYPEAKLILLWGGNPSATHIHLVPHLIEARRRGAKLAVVDPRAIPLAKGADLHLPLRPGTDLPVALSLLRWLFTAGRADEAFLAAHTTGAEELAARARPWTFERTAEVAGVNAADLERLAHLYAESSPALVRCGWGVERNRNGGSATAAVLALPAVAGKFGVRGGGFTLSNSSMWNLDTEAAVAEPVAPTRTVNMNQIGRALLGETGDGVPEGGPSIHALFVYNANPMATVPDQERMRRGLARDDLFTVVFDAVATDTAAFADVLLPSTTFLEHPELNRGYGAQVAQRSVAAVAPAGEARSNFQVFLDLGHRLGLARPGDPETPEAFVAAAVAAHGDPDGSLAHALATEGAALAPHGGRPVQFVDVFPRTPDGKVHLVSPELDREAPEGLYTFRPLPPAPAHPLALISPATHRTISSSLGHLLRKKIPLALHPEDAAARQIVDGDPVRVFNHLGEVRCRAKIDPDLRPGVVFLPKGLWSRHTDNGATSNALVPDTLADLAAGACFNDARVEVERLEPATAS